MSKDIKKLTSEDIRRALDEAFAFDEQNYPTSVQGASALRENKRIAPLAKEIIVELVSALNVYATSEYVDVKQRARVYNSDNNEHEVLEIDDSGEIAREALAKVEARLRGEQ